MNKNLIILSSLVALLACSCGSNNSTEVQLNEGVTKYSATPHNSKNLFVSNDKYTMEFNGNSLENDNFLIGDRSYPTWTFKPENVTVENGNLNLTAKYDPHISKGYNKQFYFTSGMITSKEKTTYGYFEARIKGADLWPGVCPAFWFFGGYGGKNIQEIPVNTITYSEIDVIELQQVATSKNILAMNLHTGSIKEGKDGKHEPLRLKAGIIPKICKTEFPVEWNPEDDYHIYACENRPDSIIFYIDNERVGSKANYYWHLPMSMVVSMGIRDPYERYEGWSRFAVPATQEEADAAGFPTTMYIDYVRSYTRDYSEFTSNKQLFDIESSGYDYDRVNAVLKDRKENL